jgi:hypothetical protein
LTQKAVPQRFEWLWLSVVESRLKSVTAQLKLWLKDWASVAAVVRTQSQT